MIKIINYQYLRNECDVSQNVPDKELDNPIKRSHEMFEMLIGNALYTEFVGQYPSSFSAANTLLLPYVQKFLAWQAYQFWIPKANLKDTKSGFRVMQEDNSIAADPKQMAELIRDAKMWAQTQKEKLVQFLEDNYESYPLYDYECNYKKRTGTGFHITSVGNHKKGCGCNSCRYGHS
jgi:hypothetical protein